MTRTHNEWPDTPRRVGCTSARKATRRLGVRIPRRRRGTMPRRFRRAAPPAPFTDAARQGLFDGPRCNSRSVRALRIAMPNRAPADPDPASSRRLLAGGGRPRAGVRSPFCGQAEPGGRDHRRSRRDARDHRGQVADRRSAVAAQGVGGAAPRPLSVQTAQTAHRRTAEPVEPSSAGSDGRASALSARSRSARLACPCWRTVRMCRRGPPLTAGEIQGEWRTHDRDRLDPA